jgi:hypothetical protein
MSLPGVPKGPVGGDLGSREPHTLEESQKGRLKSRMGLLNEISLSS